MPTGKIKVTKAIGGAGTTDDPTRTEEQEIDLSKKPYMKQIKSDIKAMAKSVEDIEKPAVKDEEGSVIEPRPVADPRGVPAGTTVRGITK